MHEDRWKILRPDHFTSDRTVLVTVSINGDLRKEVFETVGKVKFPLPKGSQSKYAWTKTVKRNVCKYT